MCECNNEQKVFIKCGNVLLRVADITMAKLQGDVIEFTDKNGVLQSVFTSKRTAKKAFNELVEQLR